MSLVGGLIAANATAVGAITGVVLLCDWLAGDLLTTILAGGLFVVGLVGSCALGVFVGLVVAEFLEF